MFRRTRPIKIFIADDSAVMRAAVRAYLQQYKDFTITGEASSGKDLMPVIQQTQSDIALLDVVMDFRSGIEVTRDLTDANSPVKVVLYTAHDYPRLFEQGITAGAYAIVLKTIPMEDLVAGLRLLHANKYWDHPLALTRPV